MQRVETTSGKTGQLVRLSDFERRILDVMRASRASQEQEATFHARNAIAVYEHHDAIVTYKSLACAEAKALGKQMLRLDRQRLLPIKKPVRISRIRDWEATKSPTGQKTHEITTPILLSHDPLNVVDTEASDFSVDLSAGWKFTAVTRGNDFRHVTAYLTPNPGDHPPRKPMELTADYVVHDPNTWDELVIESTVYNLYHSSVKSSTHEDIDDPDSKSFMIQVGILRAARLACGETIPTPNILDIIH